jgi:outer membrane protein
MKINKWMLILLAISTFLLPSEQGHAQQPAALGLHESIDIALKESMLIQAAREGVKGAESQKKEAFTGFLPKLSTSYAYTRLNPTPWSYVSPSTLNIPTAAGVTIPMNIPGRPTTIGTQDNYSWALEFRQPLFAGGAIYANYEASKKGEDIARVEESLASQDIVQEVKVAYFNILKAQKIKEVARQALEQLKSHRNDAQNFYDVGLIPKNDLLQSEVRLADGMQNLLRAENGLEIANSRFNTVLRRNINDPVSIEDILKYSPFDKAIEACLQTALETRSEIKSYNLRIEQMQELVKVAKGDLMPSLSAVGHYERFGDQTDLQGSTYKSQENWYIMARADWAFWEWGKTKNQIDARRYRESQLSNLLTNEKDKIAFEVKAAYLQVRESEKQIFVAQKAIEQAEENFRLNTERYKEQVATSTDVLDAQTLLTKTTSDYYSALGDFFISQARLERAMGVVKR